MNSNSAQVEHPTVLIIDDCTDSHRLAERLLGSLGATILNAYSGREGLAMAMARQPDLILLDYQMPDVDGLAVLKFLKSEPTLAAIPIIMVTASDDPQLVVDTFANGAVDYVRKPFLQSELQARVTSTLRMRRMIQELAATAQSDALTQLPNRMAFNRQLMRTIFRRDGSKLGGIAILFVDLDRFKLVNDSLGHAIGDRLIQESAKRLQCALTSNPSILRRTHACSLARVGGDEFLVLLEGVASDGDALFVAENLINALSERYTFGTHSFYSSCSIGISTSCGSELQLGADDADRHIRNADIALYEAKSSGRGCARLFDQAMRSRLEERVRLEGELRAATVNKDFHLVYQPIVQLKTGRIEFVEALIRWDHREQGVVSPSDFIPIAEETGLINEIGAWCMQTALEQFSQWRKSSPFEAPHGININIARQQLIRPRFFEQVTEIVAANQVLPSQVHLEITESEMMQDLDFSVDVMRRLRQVGFKIHIDDFGTGYSSLACLNQFPVDTLKIDRSLIANITTDRYAAKLVEFVLRLAQETNVSVIAEGIELDDQARMLEKWGCQYGQGYLMARPMIGESFVPFAKSWNQHHSLGRMKPRRTIRS